MPGFAGQPAALGLAGTSGAGGLLGGVLGSLRMFLLDLFATVCMQRRCERGNPVGRWKASEARASVYPGEQGISERLGWW